MDRAFLLTPNPAVEQRPTCRSQLAFWSPVVAFGRFFCRPGDPAWFDENWIGRAHHMVHGRVPVEIDQLERGSVVATPNTCMYYNAQQRYRRGLLHQRGDEAEYFAIAPTVVLDVVRRHDPSVADRPQHPFAFINGPSSPESFARHWRLSRYLRTTPEPDPLRVEETFMAMFEANVADAYRVRRTARRPERVETQREHRDISNDVRRLLSLRFSERLSLSDLSRTLAVSPFHLARIFLAQTGQTIHQYLTRLRLRAAFEQVVEENLPLTDIALRAGFSSHSHFTTAFRREFGRPPTEIRGEWRDLARPA